MQESTSTSNGRRKSLQLLGMWALALGAPLWIPSSPAWAEPPAADSGQTNKASQPEDDDFSTTPFTEYGEFNEASEEESDSKFFQFGRFFGVSLGLGFQAVDGFRGAMWQGGFPVFDFKLHYWFDFHFALDLGFRTAVNYFNKLTSEGHTDVNMLAVGVNIKYYIDTKNLSAPISFANPYLLLGAASFTKTQLSLLTGTTPDTDTSLGLSFGAGLEFVMSPRKTYFEIEGKIHIVNFRDTYITRYASVGIDNLTGNFYTITGSILFTW